MSDLLDQLVFGWSETGLEGRNRLQMVATSPGWQSDDRYRRVARRLSRLDASGDRDPIAFGWADLGGRRFVFRRRMVPSPTGDARRLVSHVVAGPPAELPVGLVLESFDDPFWWDGRPLDPVLAPARAGDLVAGGSGSVSGGSSSGPAVAQPLLSHLLAAPAGTPVAFEGNAHQMHAALVAIHAQVPALLEAMSCSTYETGQMASWFDLVGLDGRGRPRGSRWCSRNATEPRYDPRQVADLAQLAHLAVSERDATDAESVAAFREVLRVGERVVAGSLEALPTVIKRPETLVVALGSDLGLRGIAKALWGLDRQKWPRITPSGDGDGGTRIGRLAAATADAAPGPAAEAAAYGIVARRLHAIQPRSGPLFVERILQRRSLGHALATPDADFLAAALAWAYQTALPDPVVDALTTWVEENLTGTLLLDRRVPEPWRHELFADACDRGLLGVDDLAELAARHPHLFRDASWLPKQPAQVAGVLVVDGPLREFAARAVAEVWPIGDVVELGLALAGQERYAAMTALFSAAAGRTGPRVGAPASAAVWSMLAGLLLQSTSGDSSTTVWDLPWSFTRRLQESGNWIGPVAATLLDGRGSPDRRAAAWPPLLASASGADRAALTQVALHDLALSSRAGWAFEGQVNRLDLDLLEPALRAQVLLTALARRSDASDESLPALGRALEAAITRTGFLRLRVTAGANHEAAEEEVRRVLEVDPEAFVRNRSQLSRPVQKWLRAGGALRRS